MWQCKSETKELSPFFTGMALVVMSKVTQFCSGQVSDFEIKPNSVFCSWNGTLKAFVRCRLQTIWEFSSHFLTIRLVDAYSFSSFWKQTGDLVQLLRPSVLACVLCCAKVCSLCVLYLIPASPSWNQADKIFCGQYNPSTGYFSVVVSLANDMVMLLLKTLFPPCHFLKMQTDVELDIF